MTQAVADKVLKRLHTLYGAPNTDNPPELYKEFSAALAPYRSDILSKAVDRVRAERSFPGWPTVGELVKACRDVSEEMTDRTFNQPSPTFGKEPVSQEVATRLLGQARQLLDTRRSFPNLMATARAWARHHNCKVTVDVDQDPPMIDEHGRVVPFGWRPGGSTAQVQERSHWASLQEATGLEASEIDRIMETIPNR